MENDAIYNSNGTSTTEFEPKRPETGFQIFCNKRRNEIQNMNSNISSTEIIKILNEEWKSLPPEDKVVFDIQARQSIDEFKHNSNYPIKKSVKARKVTVSNEGDDEKKWIKIEMIPNIPITKKNSRLMWLGARSLAQEFLSNQDNYDILANWIRNSKMISSSTITTISPPNYQYNQTEMDGAI